MKGNTPPQNFIRHLLVVVFLLYSSFSLRAQQNNALSFDGVNESVEVSSLTNFDGVTINPFTIEVWFNPAFITSGGTLWSIGTNSGSSLRLGKLSGGSLFLEDVDGTILTAKTADAQSQRWHHAAVIYDGTELKLYVDAVEEGKVTRTITLEGTGIRIGQSTLPSGEFWQGQLDELRIWGYAISLTELHDRLFTGLVGSESQLLHYFSFNETSGTSTPDLAGGLPGNNLNMNDGNWVSSTATEQQTLTAIGFSNWLDPLNWSTGALPIPLDSVVISSNVAITIDTDINVYDLNLLLASTIDHTGFNVGISGDLTVSSAAISSGVTDTIFY